MKTILIGIKNVILWSYARGTWQYDVLCVLIVAAVFLLPGSFFGDRDRSHAAAPAAAIDALAQTEIAADEIRSFLRRRNEEARLATAPQEALVLFLHDKFKREVALVKHETFSDELGRIGYRVWYR